MTQPVQPPRFQRQVATLIKKKVFGRAADPKRWAGKEMKQNRFKRNFEKLVARSLNALVTKDIANEIELTQLPQRIGKRVDNE